MSPSVISPIKFEEFTTNKNALKELIDYVADGSVRISEAELTALQQTPVRHLTRHYKSSVQEIYMAWQPWQQQAFALHLKNIGGIKNSSYLQHGYDLSFVAEDNELHD